MLLATSLQAMATIPHQVKARIEDTDQEIPYRTAAEVEEDLGRVGIDKRVIDLVLQDLRN